MTTQEQLINAIIIVQSPKLEQPATDFFQLTTYDQHIIRRHATYVLDKGI